MVPGTCVVSLLCGLALYVHSDDQVWNWGEKKLNYKVVLWFYELS